MLRNITLALLGIALIAGAIVLFPLIADSKSKKKAKTQKAIKTVFIDTVKNTTIPIIIPANGRLVAKKRVEIYAEVQGIFKSGYKPFKPGITFNSGESLIRVNASEYRASVQVAKSNLYNAIASIMPDLRLDFENTYPRWQTYLNNFDLNKITPKLPEFSQEKEKLFINGKGVVSSYFNVKSLEQRLSKFNIKAPFKGVLIEALVTEGSLIRNGQKLGTFIDPSAFELEVSISKKHANLLKVGEKVKLFNIEKTQEYTGKVTRVNASVNASTQTISAFVEVRAKNLKEGMYLEAYLNAKDEENAVQISRSLLLDSNEVFIIRDSVLDVVPVKPVYFSDKNVVIKGLKNGTILLSKLVPGAYAGMQVKPISN